MKSIVKIGLAVIGFAVLAQVIERVAPGLVTGPINYVFTRAGIPVQF